MTELLAHAISEIKKLPVEDQDAIAYRLLAEIKDEQAWEKSFAETTDDQWKKMMEKVDRDIESGNGIPMDEIFSNDK